MTIKDRDFDLLVNKLGFQTRENDHLFAWFEYEGKVLLRTRRSRKRGDLPMQNSIRQQMKLSDRQVREAISCTFGMPEYLENLKARGILADED
ncbi:MAG TPA: hypothetical protein VJB57_21540 [Dehalococcoidia bacterium]|nr:hypothetical protein [Dehalococcoidia bacterium]